jgi:hypothetical protein
LFPPLPYQSKRNHCLANTDGMNPYSAAAFHETFFSFSRKNPEPFHESLLITGTPYQLIDHAGNKKYKPEREKYIVNSSHF